MGFPLKFKVENKEGGVIELRPALEITEERLNLKKILVNYEKDDNTVTLYLKSSDEHIDETSIIFNIIKNFEEKDSNYKNLFRKLETNGYFLITEEYELSNKQLNGILYDFINALDEELNIAPKPLQQFINLLIEVGYQPPEGANSTIAQLSSPSLSMFNQKKANPDSSADEAQGKTLSF